VPTYYNFYIFIIMQKITSITASTTEVVQETIQTPEPKIIKDRNQFIKKTYLHLIYGLLAFTAFNTILMFTPVGAFIFAIVVKYYWLYFGMVILFAVFHSILQSIMETSLSLTTQYMALFTYALLESVLFSPMLIILKGTNILPIAALITFVIFGIITSIAFLTKKDFSFLGSFLTAGVVVALVLILISAIFGFSLGIIFSAAMILLASGYILYDTSRIIHNYDDTQYIAAAAALMASVILLLWYVIRIILQVLSIFKD
jgi:FtsH-binding integral membrane protein